MVLNSDVGLVLEGGGMRGVFTAGVIDYLLERKLYFDYVVAVSAGACNGVSYMSRQLGRAKVSMIDMLDKYQYIGMKFLWTQHSIMDLGTIYEKLPMEVLPFDYDTFFKNKAVFEVAAFNCLSGRVEYLQEHHSPQRLNTLVKASSSLPFVCPMVEIDEVPYLDGGIADSIPLNRAIETGHRFNVVVSTREKGYRQTDKDIRHLKFFYRRYPRLHVALSHRHAFYNSQLQMLEEHEASGDVLVIRPKGDIQVGRLEKSVDKLTALYKEGYSCAAEKLADFVSPPREAL